ncbi:MAG: hypothetical protein QJR06_11165 [Alicyclobacillaceae bacterium]|nr:hypothetical protein [Alicyclobacillaceae bacterium]
MADEKTSQQQQAKQGPTATKYPREELLANAEALFGCKPEAVAGALHGNSGTEFTVSEVKSLVDAFLKRQVK